LQNAKWAIRLNTHRRPLKVISYFNCRWNTRVRICSGNSVTKRRNRIPAEWRWS